MARVNAKIILDYHSYSLIWSDSGHMDLGTLYFMLHGTFGYEQNRTEQKLTLLLLALGEKKKTC